MDSRAAGLQGQNRAVADSAQPKDVCRTVDETTGPNAFTDLHLVEDVLVTRAVPIELDGTRRLQEKGLAQIPFGDQYLAIAQRPHPHPVRERLRFVRIKQRRMGRARAMPIFQAAIYSDVF